MRLGSSLRRRRGQGDESPPPSPWWRRPEGDEEAEAFDRRRRWILITLGIVALGWGLGWALATQVLFPGPPAPGDLSEVPDLYGLELEEATRRILGAGLALGQVDPLGHPTADSGVVVGQAPLPGQLALPDAPVRVSVSTGREERPVPDVARLRGDRARTVLESAGFEVLMDSVQNELPRGRIVSLDPPPGTDLPLPGQVRITVSTGPPQVSMPVLLGLSEEEARDTLQALGLVVSGVEQVFRFGADQGRVVDQVPPAETVLERGSAVSFMVGRGDTISAPPGGR